jgi:Fur family ferric uptake transcriptional regulator
MSPAEVLSDARREVGGLGIATVYRNIRALLDEGWLETVDLPSESSRYELASQAHHHHFRCRHCEQVFDVPCNLGPLDHAIPDGFTLERHDLVLHGLCIHCSS